MNLTRYLNNVPNTFNIVGFFFMRTAKRGGFPSPLNMATHESMNYSLLTDLPKMIFSNRYINEFPSSYSIVGIGKHLYQSNQSQPSLAMKLSRNNNSLDFLNFMDSKVQTNLC